MHLLRKSSHARRRSYTRAHMYVQNQSCREVMLVLSNVRKRVINFSVVFATIAGNRFVTLSGTQLASRGCGTLRARFGGSIALSPVFWSLNTERSHDVFKALCAYFPLCFFGLNHFGESAVSCPRTLTGPRPTLELLVS